MRPTWDRVWFAPRPYHLCVLEDVFVAQQGLVLRRDGSVVDESVGQHPPAFVHAAQRAILDSPGARWPKLHGTAALCRNPGATIYGHWLIEILPKAYLACRWPDPLRFLVQAQAGPMRAIMRQSLARLGIGEEAIVEAGYDPIWVERLLMVHGLTEHGVYMSPRPVEDLQVITGGVIPEGADAIFVVRGANTGRRLVDEARILRDAREAGFTIVDPGLMPFHQQVAIFRQARHVVGVMGSALANLAFCLPGTKVFILAPDTMPDTFFWFLSGHRGLDATEVRCRTVAGRDVLFGPDLILDAADQTLVLERVRHRAPPAEPLFDPEFYAVNNPDVAAAGMDGLQHYMEFGWRENRLPSRHFDGVQYRADNPAVDASGMNPLVHFLRYGRSQGPSGFGRYIGR